MTSIAHSSGTRLIKSLTNLANYVFFSKRMRCDGAIKGRAQKPGHPGNGRKGSFIVNLRLLLVEVKRGQTKIGGLVQPGCASPMRAIRGFSRLFAARVRNAQKEEKPGPKSGNIIVDTFLRDGEMK
jgi:hypothetical protein